MALLSQVRWPDRSGGRTGPVAGRAQCLGSHTLLAVLHPTGLFGCTGPGLHPGPSRVMVYHTRSRKANNA